MPVRRTNASGPGGGLQAGCRALRGWRWMGRNRLVSTPVRCRRDEWYLARARIAAEDVRRCATLLVDFFEGDRPLSRRCLRLRAPAAGDGAELLGWLKTPGQATHLQLCVPDRAVLSQIAAIVFHNVAERDPKCHPLANTPRWSASAPPFALDRVILPASLVDLAEGIDWADVEVIARLRSRAELRRRSRAAVCILDPEWVRTLGVAWEDLERMAAAAWLLVDLRSTAGLLKRAGHVNTEVVTHTSAHGIMSARVEYADVPTRGLALQDVVPFTTLQSDGGFRADALHANRGWRRFADDAGFATLLSTETPWAQHHGDVLSAACPTSGGELIATDLPWIAAGRRGPQLTPRIAAHLLRMHLGGPLEDFCQYWNRWDDGDVIVRDLSDLARRYPPLHAVRWASDDSSIAHLGIALCRDAPRARRHILIRTGRIDNLDVHDGLPSEPMTVFMKWLAREVREQTDWARRYLADQVVTWQFDTADGLACASSFDSAAWLADLPVHNLRLRLGTRRAEQPADSDAEIRFTEDEGVCGDRSLDFQRALTAQLVVALERGGPRPPGRCTTARLRFASGVG